MTEAWPRFFCVPKFCATFRRLGGFHDIKQNIMKTNTCLLLVLLTAPVALALGASISMAFTAFVAISMLGVTSNDYAETRYSPIGTTI